MSGLSITRPRETPGSIRGRSTSCRPSRARSSRTPTASSSACSSGCSTTREPLARGISRGRFQPRLHRGRPGDLQDGEALAGCAAAERPRRGRRGALQGHPDDQDHGAAVELHLADRREGDPPRPLQADQGRLLHRGDTAAFGLPRQPVHHRGGTGLRQGAGPGGGDAGRAGGPACRGRGEGRRRRARARHPLRQPRPAALPAVRLRDVQGRARDRLAELRRGPVPGRPPRRAHGDLRPHGLGLGAVHQRVEGSDRRLRRDPQRDQARAAGVRAAARRVPAPARAGQERVPPAQHLRAVHRGGRRGLRPAEGRQAGQGQAQDPAPEDRREADRRRQDRRDPGQRRRRPGRAAPFDHRHPRRARRRGAGVSATSDRQCRCAEIDEARPERTTPPPARRKGERRRAVRSTKGQGQGPRRVGEEAPARGRQRPGRQPRPAPATAAKRKKR